MVRDVNNANPSLFHRRLVLLVALAALVYLALALQLGRLTVVQGAENRVAAEARLDRWSLLPTYRGDILDRFGRKLATDRASYDIAVDWQLITGAWQREQARRQVRGEVGSSRWRTLSPADREAAVQKRLPAFEEEAARIWARVRKLGVLSESELHDRLDAIRAEVQQTAAAHWDRQRRREKELWGDADDYVFRPETIREQEMAHVVLPRVSDEVAFEFQRLSDRWEGLVVVQDSHSRDYPWSQRTVRLERSSLPRPLASATPVDIEVVGVADHILGSMRAEVWAEDIARRPFRNPETGELDLGGYRLGDSSPASGVERVFEDYLRGTRGQINERKDTGRQQRVEPRPGGDLRLTIDIELQARIQAILSPEFGLARVQPWHANEPMPADFRLNSAAVVVEVDSGEILAMVSLPTVAASDGLEGVEYRHAQPWVNRAVEAIYPPGSIIKPLVLCCAAAEGSYSPGETIACNGHFFPHDDTMARCWLYREKWEFATHGELAAPEAIARSCNLFFYHLADRVGMEKLTAWFARFGLGERLDIGLAYPDASRPGRILDEVAGTLPDPAGYGDAGQRRSATIFMGIGQGPVTWTPLHAANAYATLARGGVRHDAILVTDDPRGIERRQQDLGLSRAVVNQVMRGLRDAVEQDHGTGNHFNYEHQGQVVREQIITAPGVTVWAKSGTAQAPPLVIDYNGDGDAEQIIKGVDHAWFVGLVGPGKGEPEYAIAVMVEYGGSGSRVAGPIANQIIRALQHHRYLPGGEGGEGGEGGGDP